MKAKFKKAGIIAFGWLLIVVGIILAIPLVPGPGSLVILAGLWVLSREQCWAHRLIVRLEQRFPKVTKLMHEAREKASEWMARWFRRNPDSAPAAPIKPPCATGDSAR